MSYNPLKVSLENIIPLTEARDHFSQIVAEVQRDKLYVLTKGGKPAVAIIDVKYLERITGGEVKEEHIEQEIQKAPEKVGRPQMIEHKSVTPPPSPPTSAPVSAPTPTMPQKPTPPPPVKPMETAKPTASIQPPTPPRPEPQTIPKSPTPPSSIPTTPAPTPPKSPTPPVPPTPKVINDNVIETSLSENDESFDTNSTLKTPPESTRSSENTNPPVPTPNTAPVQSGETINIESSHMDQDKKEPQNNKTSSDSSDNDSDDMAID